MNMADWQGSSKPGSYAAEYTSGRSVLDAPSLTPQRRRCGGGSDVVTVALVGDGGGDGGNVAAGGSTSAMRLGRTSPRWCRPPPWV